MHGCSFWCPSPSFLQVSHVTVCPAAGRFKLYMLLTTAGSVGPELTKSASGTVVKQGAAGKYATVGQRRERGGKHVRDKQNRRMGRKKEVKVGTLNVGTMTDKGRELADVMVKRKVDILCVQETRCKGSKARNIGDGSKILYHGEDGRVLEVKRVSDRMVYMKLDIEGVIIAI